MRRYELPPPIVTHPLEQYGRSWFSVIVPLARQNLVTNPSLETGTTSWSAVAGSSIARTTTQQYHGAYSLQVTPTAAVLDGAATGTIALTSGTTYAISFKVLAPAGLSYRVAVLNNALSSVLGYVSFRATGRWQWVWMFYKETSSTTRYVGIIKDNHNSTRVFYVDGAQVEDLSDGVLAPTTYIDGDQQGLVPNQFPPAYNWTGTPHASTSQRTGQTRAGGYVMPLSRYGFLLLSIIGLGMITPAHVATPYAQLDGAEYQRSLKGPRQFTLAGRIDGRTPAHLDRLHSAMAEVLDRDLIGQQQPLTLLYQKWDGDRVVSDYARLLGLYSGGMGETRESLHSMAVTPTFQLYMPFVLSDKEEGAALTVQTALSNNNGISLRSPAGVWSILGTGATAGSSVNAVLYGPDNTLYAGGSFTSINSVANTRAIAKWDGSTWTALGTGGPASANVLAFAIGPDGSLYAAGNFSSMGGVANTQHIAKWNGSAWSSITASGAANGQIRTLVVGPDGSLYAGGDFTSINGVAANRVAKMDTAGTWTALGTGAATPNGVESLVFGPDGVLYMAGSFGSAGGVADTNGVAKWNGSAWSALGTGIPALSAGMALAVGLDGSIYVGGTFTTIGGVSANRIARWNGISFTPLGSGLNNTPDGVLVRPDGSLFVVGQFSTAGGLTLPDQFARWTGAAWVYFDIILSGFGVNVNAITSRPDGTIAIGYTVPGVGSATSAANTTVTNTGSAKAYPVLTIKGPSSGTSRIYQIVNYTTGRAIYLNLTLNAGETAVLSFDPKNLSFVSDFQGNIASKVLPGSSEADFFLQPGANVISFFAAGSTVTATLRWRPAYDELAALTP